MIKILAGAFVIILATTAFCIAQEPPEYAKQTPSPRQPQTQISPVKEYEVPYDLFRIVPVRVHLLRNSTVAAAVTKLTIEDIKRIFRKANQIWHPAGVHLWVESIVEETPVKVDGLDRLDSIPEETLPQLRPETTIKKGGMNVYYIGNMKPNGIFMGRDSIFVKDSARLKEVKGGIEEPLPRVTAHELGHAMGLPHRQDRVNLMSSGTTGTGLNSAEIERVTFVIRSIPWAKSPKEFLSETEELLHLGKTQEAISRYKTLLETPGNSATKSLAQDSMRRVK